jgi:hypothetical protein
MFRDLVPWARFAESLYGKNLICRSNALPALCYPSFGYKDQRSGRKDGFSN